MSVLFDNTRNRMDILSLFEAKTLDNSDRPLPIACYSGRSTEQRNGPRGEGVVVSGIPGPSMAKAHPRVHQGRSNLGSHPAHHHQPFAPNPVPQPSRGCAVPQLRYQSAEHVSTGTKFDDSGAIQLRLASRHQE